MVFLAAIAIPSYRDYTAKATASRLIADLAPQKIKVGVNFSENEADLCTAGVQNCSNGTTDATLTSSTVSGIQVVLTSNSSSVGVGENIAWTCSHTGVAASSQPAVDKICN